MAMRDVLTLEEQRVLERLQRRTTRMETCGVVTSDLDCFTVGGPNQVPDSALPSGYREEEVISFISQLRPFLLERDLPFERVTSMLLERLEADGRSDLAAWVQHYRSAWATIMDDTGVPMLAMRVDRMPHHMRRLVRDENYVEPRDGGGTRFVVDLPT